MYRGLRISWLAREVAQRHITPRLPVGNAGMHHHHYFSTLRTSLIVSIRVEFRIVSDLLYSHLKEFV